jgi:hypothetical protein
VRWKDNDTLFGRPLFDYENADFWIVDPFTGRFRRPRKFGNRLEREMNASEEPDDLESPLPASEPDE